MTGSALTVRPFAAGVVRQQHARRTVTAMSESQDDSGVDLYRVALDPAAYADLPASLFVYRQTRGDASYTGVVADVAVRAIADGQVRGHEAVHRLRVDALIWHHGCTSSPPALVKLLHRAGPAYARVVADAQESAPVLDFDGPLGFRQTLWRLPDGPGATALASEMSAGRLYIADGHHRAAAAVEEWRSAGRPDEAGLLCAVYPLDGLTLSAFHRRISGPLDPGALLALFDQGFRVRRVAEPPSPRVGSLGLYVGSCWYDVDVTTPRLPGAAGLDVSILQSRVLDHLEPAPPGRVRTVDAVPAATPLDDLVTRCDLDDGALVTLAPPSAQAVIEVADAGEVMPPKATFFEPKPAAGMFLHPRAAPRGSRTPPSGAPRE